MVTATVVAKRIWAGRILSGLVVLFLLFDASVKLAQTTMAVEASASLGLAAHLMLPIGLIELVCLAVYVVPATSVLGAVLLTGYLGGAVVTHLRVGSPLLGYTLFPLYVAALMWGGLYLREDRLRALLPFRRHER